MVQSYPSKLLLFGEYAVISGGEGLSIPYEKYTTTWKKSKGDIHDKQFSLDSFYTYLNSNVHTRSFLDLDQMKQDLSEGYYLSSIIPVGAGLGSSGSVVAAIYERYALNPLHLQKDSPLQSLKSQLAEMENYYHKKSSGLDPLVILLRCPIHLISNGEVKLVDIPSDNLSQNFELFNSNIERTASHFIEIFSNKMLDPSFQTVIKSIYHKIVADCIESYLVKDKKLFLENILQLSAFQLEHFKFAIPDSIIERWEDGIKSRKEIFKLCGAGGGGYLFIFNA